MGGAVDWAKNNVGRVGLDVVTGGGNELARKYVPGVAGAENDVDSKIGGAINTVTGAVTPASTAGVQGAANDARNIQNQFLQQYQGLQPGTAPQMQSAAMNAAQLDPSQQAQFRQQQMGLANSLQGTINGTAGPSVAQLQQQQAFGQQEAQQQGLAAAMGRGGNQALAMRTAMNNMGQLGAQQAAQSALLRAQETATAQGQLGDVLNSGRSSDINVANANATNQQQAGALNAQNLQAANANNQQSAIATRGQDITQQQNLGSLTNQANANQVNAQVGALNAQTAQKQATGNLIATGLGAAATFSDRRLKEDIKPESSMDIRDFLNAIHPSAYRYKGTPEPKVGVMAQDVEKSGMGRTLVKDTPIGKAIDIPSATTALMAALADVHRRVSKLEGTGGR